MENWIPLQDFPTYSISDYGRVRNEVRDAIMVPSKNQSGLAKVGLMRDGRQHQRSIAKLVAENFLEDPPTPQFDTPINLDGDRFNCAAVNLNWRPRWFAIQYHHQFKNPYPNRIMRPLIVLNTGEEFENSLHACVTYGLLERDLVLSILNRTYVWPTYQEFVAI